MKPEIHDRALTAWRLYGKGVGLPEIARRYRLPDNTAASQLAQAGSRIADAEACELTDNEMAVMRALARVEVRCIETDSAVGKTKNVDFAAERKSGWCAGVIEKRLRMLADNEVETLPAGRRLGFVFLVKRNKAIWLTAPGWAFVWATRLVLPNWKVPQ